MRRDDDDTLTLSCPLDDREQDMAAEMMRQTGIDSGANLVRVGLWHLVRHLRLDLGTAFSVRHHTGTRGPQSKRLKARQLSPEEIA